ncbi:MAG: hypothetical protein WD885_01455, partial [Candidatus Saccharimonadales bacterium]
CFTNIMNKKVTMNTRILLTAIISFILGALLVSIAATTFEKERLQESEATNQNTTEQREEHLQM